MADFGWAFVRGGIVTGSAEVSGGVQYNDGGSGFAASSDLVFISGSTSQLNLTGALNVSGAINANELNITVTNQNVVNISSTGSTKFGDTSDDVHQFTGSVNILGNLSSSVNISASAFYGDGSNLTGISANPGGSDTQIQFNDAGSFGGSTGLTYDSTTLAVTGNISASVNVSASAFYGDGSNLTSLAGGSNNEIQLNNSGELDGSSNLTFDGTSLDVLGQVSASLGITASAFHGDGSNLTNMAGGSNNEIQINNSGDLSGSTGLTYDSITLAVTGNISASVNISASAFYGDGSNLSGIATTLDEVTNNGNTTTNAMTASALNLTGLSAGTATHTSFLALDSSNNVVLTSSNGGNSTMIGEAEDGTYTDGLFSDFTTTTLIGTAVDKFNEILKIIVPGPAPAVDRIDYTNTSGIETKLSFQDQSDAPTDYVDVGTTGSFSSNVLIDEQYTVATSGEDFRLGVYDGTQEITGVINFHVAEQFKTSELNYSNNAFGNAESGSLKLYLNEVELHSINLASTTGTGNPNTGSASDLNSSGSGFFDISITASATDQNGSEYDIFQHRTAKYVIDPQDQNKGWNYAKIEHEYGSTTYVTNFVQWFNDTDASNHQLSVSNQSLSFVGNGSRYLSGVEYFRSGSLEYTAEVDNFYKFTYPTGNVLTFNTSSNMQNISPSGAAPTDGNDLYNKIIQITASSDTNTGEILDTTATVSINLEHPLKNNIYSTGSVTVSGILIYDSDTESTNLTEYFESENKRLIGGAYDTQASASDSGNLWNSQNHMTSSGAEGHTDGLLFYDGKLFYPTQGANSGDFSVLASGPSGNPDYSSVTGNRTFYRKIQNTSGSPIRDLKITTLGNSRFRHPFMSQTDRVRASIKIPGVTGWMEVDDNFSYGNIADGDGALINGADENDNSPPNLVHCITFGTASIPNNEYAILKLEAPDNWNKYISQIDFQLGASDENDVVTPDELGDLSITTTTGVDAKLSFGASNSVSGFSNVSGIGSLVSVDSNGLFDDDEDFSRGVHPAYSDISGRINPTSSIPLNIGVNGAFIDAHTGSLILEINGSTLATIDLETSRGVRNVSNGTGGYWLALSEVDASETSDGIPDYTKQFRTGTWAVRHQDSRAGWNYVRLIHRIGSEDRETSYVEWVLDTSSSDDTSISSPTLTNFGHTDVYYQSGIGYFASNPTASFSFSGSNFYNNVYQNGTAISFPTLNSASVGSITGSGTGLTTLSVSGNEMDMPALDNSADCELTEIVVTASVTYTGNTSISGGLGIFTARNSGLQSTIIHPLKTNRTTTLAEKTAFMRYSGSIGSTTLTTDEYFGLETYRIVSGNYANQSDITSSSNTWNSQTHMDNGGSHDDGMVTSNGYLISPLKIGNAGDTQNTADGGSLQAPSGNPDYSTLTEDVRTYYRHFRYTGATTVSSFTANIKGDATLVAKAGSYSGTLGANKNCHIEFKVSYDPNFPSPDDNSTVWCDMAKIADSGDPTLQTSGQDGAGIRSGGLTGEDQTIDDPSGLDLNLTLGGSRVKQNQYFVVKISAHKNWTGYIKQLNFDLT